MNFAERGGQPIGNSMPKLRLLLLPLITTTLLASGPAVAGMIDAGTYRLFDHGDGQLGPAYGLRVDALNEVFSFELGAANVELFWDGAAVATITGFINENAMGGNGGVGAAWVLDYTLSGVAAVGTQGFSASGGSGTLTDPFNNVTVLTGEQNTGGDAFLFLADGHRLDGDSDSPVARGWLLPPGSTDDFLARAEKRPVPEPPLALLLTFALAGLGLVARGSS